MHRNSVYERPNWYLDEHKSLQKSLVGIYWCSYCHQLHAKARNTTHNIKQRTFNVSCTYVSNLAQWYSPWIWHSKTKNSRRILPIWGNAQWHYVGQIDDWSSLFAHFLCISTKCNQVALQPFSTNKYWLTWRETRLGIETWPFSRITQRWVR